MLTIGCPTRRVLGGEVKVGDFKLDPTATTAFGEEERFDMVDVLLSACHDGRRERARLEDCESGCSGESKVDGIFGRFQPTLPVYLVCVQIWTRLASRFNRLTSRTAELPSSILTRQQGTRAMRHATAHALSKDAKTNDVENRE